MDLEELNQQYVLLKKNLESTRIELEDAEKKVTLFESYKETAQAALKAAKVVGDTNAQQQAQQDIQKAEAQLKPIQKEVEAKRTQLKYLSEQINEKVNAVRAMPEVKADLDKAISKRAERQAVKKEKEIKELEDKSKKLDEQQAKIEALQELAKGEHTSNFMIGMVAADQELKALKAELKGLEIPPANYSDPARAAEIQNKLIPAAEKKFAVNKKPLMAVIQKKKINLTEKDLKDMLLDKAVLDKNGKVDFSKTFGKQLNDIKTQKMVINRQLKSKNKQLMQFRTSHEVAKTEIANRETALTEANKPKWWQFATRLKNWREDRKIKKEEKEKEKLKAAGFDVEEEQQQTEKQEGNSREEHNSRNEFTQTLKYDIVRDTMQTVMREYAKQQQMKENENENKENKDTGREE